ncbi:MAG: mechanosensitive ion channel domain-containing protein [Erythrobacter sp.]
MTQPQTTSENAASNELFDLGFWDISKWTIDWSIAIMSAVALAVGLVVAYALYRLIFAAVSKLAKRSDNQSDDLILERIRLPIKWTFLAIGVSMAAQSNLQLAEFWEPFGMFLQPALLGWIAFNLVKALTAVMELRMGSKDPVAMRSRRTRIALLSRLATIAIIVITVGLMLFSIPSVQAIGTTMLASAGLAALAVGAAAQPALKSLIAGLQVALTEPMRIGDLVVVDGHTGRVEEIRMSFVTLRIWDERLVIVPTDRFLTDSFENWSRRSERLTGPVFLHLDPATDIAPIRAEFKRFTAEHKLHDQRKVSLLMTEAYPESIELRLSMSAKTIGDLWELRCETREHMIDWLRREMPDALIRHRLEVENANERAKK